MRGYSIEKGNYIHNMYVLKYWLKKNKKTTTWSIQSPPGLTTASSLIL